MHPLLTQKFIKQIVKIMKHMSPTNAAVHINFESSFDSFFYRFYLIANLFVLTK